MAVVRSSGIRTSTQSNIMRLLFFWTISLVVKLSEHAGTEALKELAGTALTPVNSDRNVIQIAIDDEKQKDGLGLETLDSNAFYRSYSLQRRDPVSAIIGIGGGYGVAYMVVNNLGNMETFVKHAWHLIMKVCFHQGTKLKNGGCMSVDGKFITWKGEILEFVHETVHVFVLSPKDCFQAIVITGRRVFHNNKQIVQNIDLTEELQEKPSYQKRTDKSYWYTNLPVGELMTTQEITEFKDLQSQVQLERDRALHGVLSAARRNAARAVHSVSEQGKRTIERLRGSTSSSSDGSSQSISDESSPKCPPMDGDDSGYDSVFEDSEIRSLLDKAGFKAEIEALAAMPIACNAALGSTPRPEEMTPRPNTAWRKVAYVARILKALRRARHWKSSSPSGELDHRSPIIPNSEPRSSPWSGESSGSKIKPKPGKGPEPEKKRKSGESSEPRPKTPGERIRHGSSLFRALHRPHTNGEGQGRRGTP